MKSQPYLVTPRPHLFTPLSLRGVTFKNRIALGTIAWTLRALLFQSWGKADSET